MKFNGLTCASALVLTGMAATSAFAKTNTWTATSQAGHWAEASNWKENVALAAGDYVKIPDNLTATMNDDDFEAIPEIEGVIMGGSKAVYVIDVSGTKTNLVSWAVSNNGKNSNSGAAATMIKLGVGHARLVRANNNWWYWVNMQVDEGTLHLPVCSTAENIQIPKITVNSPGVLVTTTSSTSYTKFWPQNGLVGDGTVINPSSYRCLMYIGGSGTFSGRLLGQIAIYNDINQTTTVDFRTTEATSSQSHDIAGNTRLGLLSIGGISADNTVTNYGSIGTGIINFRNNSGIRYLGEGETSHARISAASYIDSWMFTIDGGANGGLTLANYVNFSSVTGHVSRLNLEGSNTTVCTLSAKLTPPKSGKGSLSIAKRGSGTWKLTERTDSTQNGLISVENGTLQFTTLAERGFSCSLGLANYVAGDYGYSATVTDNMIVPYAWLLGNTTTMGTLEYVGSEPASCSTRPLAVRGSAKVLSSGGALSLAGASAVKSGQNTLILAGESGSSTYTNVTDGAGTLAVVKEGAGTWRLGGTLDFSGGIDVKAGTLELDPQTTTVEYDFYRLNMKERHAKNAEANLTNIDLGKISLFDKDNKMQNHSTNYVAAANGKPWALKPGECALENSTPNFDYNQYSFQNGGTPNNLFLPVSRGSFARIVDARYTGAASTKFDWPWLENTNSWVRVVFRMPTNHNPIVSYELGSRWGKNCLKIGGDCQTYIECNSWSLDGSSDGIHWTELSSVVSNTPAGGTSSWFGNGNGYSSTPSVRPITTTPALTPSFASGTRLSVASGATAKAKSEVSVTEFDASTAGIGTVDGFTFAGSGKVKITGTSKKLPNGRIEGVFANCTGDMGGWSVYYNDVLQESTSARPTANGLEILRRGTVIYVR